MRQHAGKDGSAQEALRVRQPRSLVIKKSGFISKL
jgi:hypothetical protein